jgi:hypothetical protein
VRHGEEWRGRRGRRGEATSVVAVERTLAVSLLESPPVGHILVIVHSFLLGSKLKQKAYEYLLDISISTDGSQVTCFSIAFVTAHREEPICAGEERRGKMASQLFTTIIARTSHILFSANPVSNARVASVRRQERNACKVTSSRTATPPGEDVEDGDVAHFSLLRLSPVELHTLHSCVALASRH